MGFRRTKDFSYSVENNEVVLKNCISKPETNKIVVPSKIDGNEVLDLDGGIFKWEISHNSELIIEEGIKRITNFDKLIRNEWNKVILPKSVEYMSIDEDACLLFEYSDTIYVVSKNSYAEDFLKKISLETEYRLLFENEDVDISSERIKEIKEFRYSECYEYEMENVNCSRISAEYYNYSNKKSTSLVIPSVVNGEPLNNFYFKRIPKHFKKIVIPKTIINIIGLNTYYDTCEGIEDVVISPDNPSFWTDGLAIFSKDKKRLIRFISRSAKEYPIPEGTEVICERAFAKINNLISITIPSTVDCIEDGAFYECEKLEVVSGLENVKKVGKNIIEGCRLKKIKPIKKSKSEDISLVISGKKLIECKETSKKIIQVPDGVLEIDDNAFEINSNKDVLEEVILPNSLKKIGEYAFFNRKNLKKIEIPSSVEEIKTKAFMGCSSLDTINIPDKLSEINIYELGDFKSLIIPKTVKKINIFDEYFCDENKPHYSHYEVDCIEVDPENPNYKSIDGMLFSKDGKRALYMPSNLKIDVLEIPEGIVEICNSFAVSNEHIKEVKIPSTVEVIGPQAFCQAKKLERVVFDKHSNLKRIKNQAFDKTAIEEIDIPNSVVELGEQAFANTNIKKVELPKSIQILGDAVFEGTSEIVIYDSIDPGAGGAYNSIDIANGKPNSSVGFIGIGLRPSYIRNACNQIIKDYTITVKSAETDEIKYKVWMGANRNDRDYYCFLASAWGKNGTFAFRELDRMFPNVKGKEHKLKIAEYRLKYPIELTSEKQDKYIKYLNRYSDSTDIVINDSEKNQDSQYVDATSYLENVFGENVFKVFNECYEELKKLCDEFIHLVEETDFSNVTNVNSFLDKIIEVRGIVANKYNDNNFPYKFDVYEYEENTLSINVCLKDIIYSGYGFLDEFEMKLIEYPINPTDFDASKGAKQVVSKTKKARETLFDDLVEFAMQRKKEGKIFILKNSDEHKQALKKIGGIKKEEQKLIDMAVKEIEELSKE